jgi:transcriptional regulator with XRE-family HTH domain
MALEELREALDVTQAQRAARLTVNQSAISRLDRLTDMYVGTLRNVIAAMGGKLEIRAVFPEGQVAAVN